jgi:hypothetical protein
MKTKFLRITRVNEHLRIYSTFGNLLCLIDQFEISFQKSVTVEELETIYTVAKNFDLWFSNLTEMEVKNV